VRAGGAVCWRMLHAVYVSGIWSATACGGGRLCAVGAGGAGPGREGFGPGTVVGKKSRGTCIQLWAKMRGTCIQLCLMCEVLS